jgi:WD40 repeat protein
MKKVNYLIILAFCFYIPGKIINGQTAPELSTDPLVVMNGEGHFGYIEVIAISPQSQFMVSSGSDKKLRVYSLAENREIRSLNIPYGEGKEGLIRAIVFLNKDTIICGGETGYSFMDNCFYVINISSGKIVKRVGHLPGTIFNKGLSLSGKGDLVCVSYWKGGFEVYNTTTWEKVFSDFSGSKESTGAGFTNDNKIVAVTGEGRVSLYSESFKKMKESRVSIKTPYAPVFSSKNTFITGSSTTGDICIFSTTTLKLIKKIQMVSGSVSGYRQGLFDEPSSSFIAVGDFRMHEMSKRITLIYLDDGSGEIIKTAVSPAMLFSVGKNNGTLYCGDGLGDIFAFSDNKFVSVEKTLALNVSPVKRDLGAGFVNDQTRLVFYNRIQNSFYQIDFTAMQYTQVPGLPSSFIKKESRIFNPLVDADFFTSGNTQPKYHDQILKLESGDKSYAYALRRDDEGFYLGTSGGRIIFYSKDGKRVWVRNYQIPVQDMNTNADDSVMVLAQRGGVFRWIRVSDGRILLSFFPHPDGKRWIAWTPRGFYAYGENSEDLIGWHINQTVDKEALFFPASTFSIYLNKPEIIKEVLSKSETDDEVMKRIGIAFTSVSDLSKQLLDLARMKDEAGKQGKPVGRIYSVNAASGLVIVASARAGELIQMKDSLYVYVDGKKIFIEADFPMMTTVKCRAGNKTSRQDLSKIVQGMQVYK